jgi:metal-sulfur cluster biosynthetic enzyme
MRQAIISNLKKVYDPEIPVDIWELGLIYNISIKEDNHVDVTMTLTSPNCPVAETLPLEVEQAVLQTEGVKYKLNKKQRWQKLNHNNQKSVNLELTFDPPFTPDMMSEEAKFSLGMM